VHRITLPGRVTGMTDDPVRRRATALADPRLVGRRPSGSMLYSGLPPDRDAAMRSNMLRLDPPEHTRMRKLVSAAFTQRR
jgi:cytochrome P450